MLGWLLCGPVSRPTDSCRRASDVAKDMNGRLSIWVRMAATTSGSICRPPLIFPLAERGKRDFVSSSGLCFACWIDIGEENTQSSRADFRESFVTSRFPDQAAEGNHRAGQPSRRLLLRALSALPLGLAGAVSPVRSALAGAAGQPPLQGAGIETQSGQALYSFPRDHAWHGGAFYQTNDFNEWHYITILGKNTETGERVSVFWVPLSQGWMESEQRPLNNALFAYHNLDTGEFQTSLLYVTGKLDTQGSAPDSDPRDFFFRYNVDDGKNGFTTEYRHAGEQWKMSGYNIKDDMWNQPFKLDFTGELQAPGYVPMAYWGLESIGVDPQERQNPETMFGLTYYYTAPMMTSRGTVQLKDKLVKFQGEGWFEHQWGNFRNTFQYRYFWAWFRFTNGDAISLRQYYAGEDFRDPHYDVNRFIFLDGRTGKRSYAFGPALKVIPMKMWTSPKSGKSYPWYGRIETPKGTWYYEPTHPEQEGYALAGPYIEGCIQLREGSPEGPIVATGFTEMIALTDPLPDGNDPSEGPAITRSLPEDPKLPWRAKPLD